MARFIDQSPEEINENETFASVEEAEEQVVEEAVEPTLDETPEPENDIPEKYQGKDIKDIVQMHQEAEKLLGRQSSEVGELRKIVDDFVKTQIQATNSPQSVEEDEVDFFTDPDKAVARAIANHPSVKQAEATTVTMQRQAAYSQLQGNHPDFADIVSSTAFQEWVMASPVRQELYQRADQQFDYSSANELLTTWKERQNLTQATAEAHEADRKRQLKSASTGNAKGSSEAPSRKIYRRADIIKLMQTDPKRYNQLSDEIMAAYAEGRVK